MNRPASAAGRVWRDALFGGSLTWRLLSDSVAGSRASRRTRSPSTAVIVGGELFNKGAQAMTFTVVDQLRRRHPGLEPVLLSGRDFARPASERERYSFEILPWGTEVRTRMLAPWMASAVQGRWPPAAVSRVREVLARSRWLLDVDGYALTSAFGFRTSLSYLSDLAVARRFGIPAYLLPQSFGPFEYSPVPKTVLEPFLRVYLPYPERIWAREEVGARLLFRYTDDNVERSPDLVLQHGSYRSGNLYRSSPPDRLPNIAPNGAGVVPNSKVLHHGRARDLWPAYRAIVHALLDAGKVVYVFRHATEDLNLCREIKGLFPHEDRVVLLEEDFDALELERIIGRLELVVASRYHSLVHAYRTRVPALILGWAAKYGELASTFGQSEYVYDAREGLPPDRLAEAARSLARRRHEESAKIGDRLGPIRRRPVLDRLR